MPPGIAANERDGPRSNRWSTGRMTRRPVPPRRPWFRSRARLARVPGVSLPYQLRISRTRSFIASLPPRRSLVATSSHTTAGPAAAHGRIALHGVAERCELGLRHPADLVRIDLGVAVQASPPLRAVVL